MLQFQLTPEDYIAANQLHTRWTRARWLRSGIFVVALAGFALWQYPGSDPLPFVAGVVAAYGALIVLMMLTIRYAYLPWRARRIFLQTKALQRPFFWAWNEDELTLKTDLANGIVPWSDLRKWSEGESIFLRYASDIVFYIIPKRAFSDEAAVDAFREKLRAKIAARSPPQAAF